MTITEKKPLLIRIPGEITPNELPITASAVGYDFVEGNYLIYATGSDSWVTAPPNTAGIQEYWQSDINNQIFTTGSIVVSGSVILGDAASDVVYISGSVTASNGLLVNGNLKVNGGVVTYGGTTADGVTVGQVFEDPDTTGGSYGLVVKNAGITNGKPFLAFVQGSTIGNGYAGGISGWTKAPANGYIQGVNIATPASYPNVGFNINGSNIARFNAGGLQVTGSVNVSNGVKVAAGGLQVAGIVPGISAPYNDTPVIIDLASGQQYGPVIRSVTGQYNFAALSLDQNGTYLGGIYGIENDPVGYGYVDGVNIYSNGASRKINFNVNQVSVGKFSSTGLQVTGSIYTQMLKVNGSITDGTITIPGAGSGFSLRGSAFLDDTDASGNSYGTVIRSQAGNLAYASLSFIQDNTYAGSLSALNNTPAGTTYGYRGGLNISAAEGKIINFRIAYPSVLSVGNFNANGLEVTGSVASTLGFSGSLTRLTDGTPYIIAGPNITLTTGSKGQIAISGSASSATGKQHLSGKEIVGSTSPIMTSQFSWIPSDYTGLSFVGVRAIMATDGTANLTGSLQIYNLTSGSYVDLIDTPTVSSYFTVTSSSPTFITSSNLLSGITNFDNNADSIYEVRVSGSTTDKVVVGSVELIFR